MFYGTKWSARASYPQEVCVLASRPVDAAIGGDIQELVQRYRSGDVSAFEQIFELYKDHVYSVALHFCRNRATAEDITQSVFLKLMDRLSQYRNEACFDTWLFAIVRNSCFDAARRTKCRGEEELTMIEPALPPSQLEEMERREAARHVRLALASLGPKLRHPLLLRYVAGLSYEEIATALGASHGTVASRLNRAHFQLARALRKYKGIVAAAFVLLVILGALFVGNGRGVELRVAQGNPSQLERLAMRLHQQRIEGSLKLDYRTTSPGAARAWMAQHGGVIADIAMQRPPEDGNSYQLEGVSRVEFMGHSATLVAYRVDSHIVTLIAARSRDFADHPVEAMFSKRIFYHTNASGEKVITWSISGKSYSLVSDLPGFGQQGCFLCHTDASRRKTIRTLAP